MQWPSQLPVPRGVLFDLDGVIVDSTRAHAGAWSALFAEEGIPFGLDDYLRIAAGRSRDAVLREVLGEGHDHSWFMNRKVELMDWSAVSEVPGTLDFVRALHLPFAVATSSRTPERLLQAVGARKLFDVIVQRGDVSHGKPAPDVFVEAARRLGVLPERCLVIEDSEAGALAGVLAGCTVVGIGSVERAHLQVDSLPLSWLEDWSGSRARHGF